MAQQFEWKKAFIIRRSLYESLVMLFGLANVLAQFWIHVNYILADILDRFVTAYISDVLISLETKKEYRGYAKEVVRRFDEVGF